MKNSDLCETQTLNYRCTGKHKVFFQFLDILRQTTMYPNSENEQINFLIVYVYPSYDIKIGKSYL